MNNTMARKFVVTGGAGFIGSHLSRRLVELGGEVHVIDDLSFGDRSRVPSAAALEVADIRDGDALQRMFRGADTVFHLAAISSVQLSIDSPVLAHSVNSTGTVTVLDAARRCAVRRVVYASSSAVYGNQSVPTLHEDLPAAPDSLYGLSKYEGELAAKLFSQTQDLQAVSLRYFNVYGPGQNPDGPYAAVIARFVKARRAGLPLHVVGDGRQTRDFIMVDDVVSANLAAATSSKVGRGEVINIGTGSGTRIIDLAHMIGGDIEHVSERSEIRDSAANNGRARDWLQFSPKVVIDEGIARMLGADEAR